MTTFQLHELRVSFSTISTIDPCGDTYKRMIALLDALPQRELRQLAKAQIKFLSLLALNRVKGA